MSVKAASLNVLDDMRDYDPREIHRVMNQELLETARFPEITFRSTKITAEKQNENLFRTKIEGDLSLHGVTP